MNRQNLLRPCLLPALAVGLLAGCASAPSNQASPREPVGLNQPTHWSLRVTPYLGWKRVSRDWVEAEFILGGGPWVGSGARSGTWRRGRRPFGLDTSNLSVRNDRLVGTLHVHRPRIPSQRIEIDLPVSGGRLSGTVTVRREKRDGNEVVREAKLTGRVRNATARELSGIGGPDWPAWTKRYAWTRVVDVTDVSGRTWDDRIAAAQQQLGDDGGVVYLPNGTYELERTVRLRSGVVLRGAGPTRTPDARKATYEQATKLVFPRYEFSPDGNGTPSGSAFKGIELADPSASDVGLVDLHIDNGHVHLGRRQGFAKRFARGQAGKRWLVTGCILRNAAVADPDIPVDFQHPWQRWTHMDAAAIWCYTGGDVLIANNRIPRSGEASFTQPGFRVYRGKPATHQKVKDKTVVTIDARFDYDNRPGIAVNAEPLAKGLEIWWKHSRVTDPPTGTDPNIPPEWALAEGIDIRQNYVYCTGRAAIETSGDGAFVGFNVIRYEPDVIRPTYTGLTLSNFTNDNRAIEMKGWRWTVEGNDYEVYSNYGPAGNKYVDGEGIMHEAWENVGVRDSRIINNRGNAYICLWRTPVKGLEIRGNHVRAAGQAAVTVLGITNKDKPLPCRNVVIEGNTTEGSGIRIVGEGSGNVVRNNRHLNVRSRGFISNFADAEVSGNRGYQRRDGKSENYRQHW